MTLAGIIPHLYAVIINPNVAPMSMHWLTGTMLEHILKEEHKLEWKAWKAKQALKKVSDRPKGENDA